MSAGNATSVAPPQSATVRSVTLLGATGSVGSSTVDLIRRGGDRYRVEAVTAHRNGAALGRLAIELGARFAGVADEAALPELKSVLAGTGIAAGGGEGAIVEAAERPADWLLAAISGAAGLRSALSALRRGATVALANKECLVCAGGLFMRTAAASGATVLPVDSEHNALFQALSAGRRQDLRRAILTASGGPFRTWSIERMRQATPEQALRHPNWTMGPKITIDSATLMNKALELIEAHHLFTLAPSELDVLVHPQSVVHGLVEFRDGSVVAQLGAPDMRIPIAHCLAWPERIDGPVPPLDLATIGNLTFEAPDPVRFPALRLVRRVLESDGASSTIFNAANEIAVESFISHQLGFAGIATLVEACLDEALRQGITGEPADINAALEIDRAARRLARDLLPEIAAKAS